MRDGNEEAENLIAEAIAGDGAVLNAIVLAELCVGQTDPLGLETELRSKSVQILDVPAAGIVGLDQFLKFFEVISARLIEPDELVELRADRRLELFQLDVLAR